MVEEDKFREDLWYRLNVVRIVLPPLCERHGDVPLLAHYFLKKYNERYPPKGAPDRIWRGRACRTIAGLATSANSSTSWSA